MARKPRLHVDAGIYHVMLRGNGGQDIYADDEDRQHFYLLMQEGAARYGYRIHGFCLMSNHVHLVVEVGEQPLAKIMQNLSFRYTRWVNTKQKRTGHLFQGRYQAILVERDSYLLELVRYVHLNPVRAKLVRQAHLYRWSGHRAYLGREVLPWLTTEWVLGQFGTRLGTSQKRYETFVREGYGEGRREDFHCGGDDDGRVLGDDRFTQRILKKPVVTLKHVSLNTLIQTVCRERKLTEKVLASASRERVLSEARSMVGWLAQQRGQITLTEVAKRLNRDVATLSRGVRQLGLKAQTSKALTRKLGMLNNAIAEA